MELEKNILFLSNFRSWHETTYEEILDSKPLNNETVLMNRALYGMNEISINLTSIVRLLLDEVCWSDYALNSFVQIEG